MATSKTDDAPAAAVSPTEDEYPRAEHIELAVGMYGEPAHVVAGALSLLDPEGESFTKAEVASAIKQFLNHKPTREA